MPKAQNFGFHVASKSTQIGGWIAGEAPPSGAHQHAVRSQTGSVDTLQSGESKSKLVILNDISSSLPPPLTSTHNPYFQASVGAEVMALLNLIAYEQSKSENTMAVAQAGLIFKTFNLGIQEARLLADQTREESEKYMAAMQGAMAQMAISISVAVISIVFQALSIYGSNEAKKEANKKVAEVIEKTPTPAPAPTPTPSPASAPSSVLDSAPVSAKPSALLNPAAVAAKQSKQPITESPGGMPHLGAINPYSSAARARSYSNFETPTFQEPLSNPTSTTSGATIAPISGNMNAHDMSADGIQPQALAPVSRSRSSSSASVSAAVGRPTDAPDIGSYSNIASPDDTFSYAGQGSIWQEQQSAAKVSKSPSTPQVSSQVAGHLKENPASSQQPPQTPISQELLPVDRATIVADHGSDGHVVPTTPDGSLLGSGTQSTFAAPSVASTDPAAGAPQPSLVGSLTPKPASSTSLDAAPPDSSIGTPATIAGALNNKDAAGSGPATVNSPVDLSELHSSSHKKRWFDHLSELALHVPNSLMEISRNVGTIISQKGVISYLEKIEDVQKSQKVVESFRSMMKIESELYQAAVEDLTKEIQGTLDAIKSISEQTRKMSEIH